jgi:hypothetical protein
MWAGLAATSVLASIVVSLTFIGATPASSLPNLRSKGGPLSATIRSSFNADRMTLAGTCGTADGGGSFCGETSRRDRGFIVFSEGEELRVRLPESATSVRANAVRRKRGVTKVQFPPTVHAKVVSGTDRKRWTFRLPTVDRANAVLIFVHYRKAIKHRGDRITEAAFTSLFGGAA